MFDSRIFFVYFNKTFIEKNWVLKQNQLKATPTYGEHFYEYSIKQAIEQSRQEWQQVLASDFASVPEREAAVLIIWWASLQLLPLFMMPWSVTILKTPRYKSFIWH